jgi:predicted  nucleic acid-binding Zn-ribbon protein
LINRSLSEVADLVEQSRSKIDSTIASAARATSSLDTGVMDVLVRELELDSDPEVTLLTKVHDAFTGLNESLADLNVVTEGAKEIVVLNKDRISQVVENITTASEHLKRGVRDLELHPWRLIFKPSVGEKRELHMLNVAREFAEAAADIDDSTSRLQSLLDVHEGRIRSDDPSLAEIRARLLETVRKFGEAEQALWVELKVE